MTGENEDYIKERYQEVKEKVTYKDFLKDLEDIKIENVDAPFLTQQQLIDMVIEKYAEHENIQQTHTNQIQPISSLIEGNGNISIQGRLISISNIKTFTTKKGREGKVANLTVEDNSGKIRVVMWTDNMKYMNRIEEGNIIKVNNLEVRKGYTGDLEVQMKNNSSIQVLPEEVDPSLPKYEEKITNLSDITEDGEYNIIVRIKKISTLREIIKGEKTLQIITLEIMDKTGTLEFTLWNKDTKLVDTLELKEHDTIKIIKARAQQRYDQITLSNSWNGRIIKNEYDVPDFEEEILKIGYAEEKEDVTIIGTITKIYDTITFTKTDG
ncbi:OB-fold nucleic acid binding domain-containing protein, partial [Methanosphaera stadtmanae]